MSIQKPYYIRRLTQVLLVICMLFFIRKSNAQSRVQKVYDSIEKLSITNKEKIKAFTAKIIHTNYANKEAHANVCYLVVRFCSKVDKASAIPFLEKELTLRKKYVATNKDLISRTYYNLGLFHSFQEDYNNTLSYLDSLFSSVSKEDKRCGKAYGIIARVYKNTGDYQRALTHYAQAEKLLKEFDIKRSLLNTYISQLGLYVEQRIGVERKDFEALQQKIASLTKNYKASEEQKLTMLFNAGAMLYHYKEYDTSLNNYSKAMEIAEALQDSLRIAKIYTNTALIKGKNDALSEAVLLNDKAFLFVGNNNDQKSTIYDNLGDIYLHTKQYKKALSHYNKAINTLLPFEWETNTNLPEYEKIKNSPHQRILVDYLVDKLNGWLDFYEFTKNKKYVLAAEQTLELIDKVIDHLYFESKEKTSKLFWRKKGAKLYLNAVKVCFLLNKPEKAFYYVEKNKGIVLLNTISEFKAKQVAKLPQTIMDKEFELHKKVKTLELELKYDLSNDSLSTEYFTAKEAYYKYMHALEKEYPMYSRYRTSLPILSANQIRNTLGKNEIVIAYILGAENGYVLCVSQENVSMYQLNDLVALQTKINMFKAMYSKPFETAQNITDYQNAGYAIYKKIFPFQSDATYQKSLKITVIPDGFLNSLPLEILPTTTQQSLEESYLIRNKEISYQYSFSLNAQNDANLKKNVAKSTAFMLTKFQDSSLMSLTVKPTELFEDVTHTNEKATKENFLKAYNEASEVYISSHAGKNNELPWLAMFDEKIYPNDLYFLNNPKELVVLNACKTATGIFQEGEGVFSLTRAFLNSGSKSVVATMWNLNETAGMEILTNFRSNLSQSQSKSEALRNAKLSYLEKHKNSSESSPYYWGAITLTGNTEALPKTFSYWWFISIGIIIVFGLTYIFWKQQKKRKSASSK